MLGVGVIDIDIDMLGVGDIDGELLYDMLGVGVIDIDMDDVGDELM